jgi:hypothetical protein
MAQEQRSSTDIVSMQCGAAVVQGCAVKMDTTVNTVIHSTAITSATIGVAMTSGATGEWIPVQIRGIAKMKCAAAVTLNTEVMVQAAAGNGTICDATGATARCLGVALEASAGAGEFVKVLLNLPAVKHPPNA